MNFKKLVVLFSCFMISFPPRPHGQGVAGSLEEADVSFSLIRTIKDARIHWPKSVFLSPDGKKAFVHNLQAMNTISIDTESFSIEKVINHKGKPVASAFTENGRYLWVSLLALIGDRYPPYVLEWTTKDGWDETYRFPSVIQVYDRMQEKIIHEIPVGIRPKVLAVSPDENYVLVSNWSSHSISVIDAHKFQVIKEIPVGKGPRGICFLSPQKAYVANKRDRSISIIDMEKLEVTGTIREGIGEGPRHLVLSPDHRKAYLSVDWAGRIQILDTQGDKLVGEISVGKLPRTIVLHPEGRYLFLGNYASHTVGVVDLEQKRQVFEHPTDRSPIGLALSPDGRRLWVTNYRGHSVQVFDVVFKRSEERENHWRRKNFSFIELTLCANADYRHNPFLPNPTEGSNHFPELHGRIYEWRTGWRKIPFRVLDSYDQTKQPSVITTGENPYFSCSLLPNAKPSRRLYLAVDGAWIRKNLMSHVAKVRVEYNDGTGTEKILIANQDVWTYSAALWGIPVPSQCQLWRGSRGEKLTVFQMKLDPRKVPKSIEIVTLPAAGREGKLIAVAIFSITQEFV